MNLKLPDDYLEIKADVFRIIRANSDCRSARKVLAKIKQDLPDVSDDIFAQIIGELLPKD